MASCATPKSRLRSDGSCQDSVIWKGFFKVSQMLDTTEACNQGINDVLKIVNLKKAEAKKILKVPVSFQKNLVEAFKEKFSKDSEKEDES